MQAAVNIMMSRFQWQDFRIGCVLLTELSFRAHNPTHVSLRARAEVGWDPQVRHIAGKLRVVMMS